MLLFWAETWVLNPCMEQSMCRFQHRVEQRLTRKQPRRRGDGSWNYPPLEAATAEAGLEEIGVYVTRRQNTLTQYIATLPILDLCEWSMWRPGAWVSKFWW